MAGETLGIPQLDEKVQEWLKWDKNEKTLAEIKSLVDEKNTDELSKLLLKRISFGTAGLRGKMSAGYTCMNDLVIIQTGQGLLKYLEDVDSELLDLHGIIIGYDGRHNSRRWAELTAAVFLHAGIEVKLFGKVNPTPFVPFAVTKYECIAGVMITASHNPKEDNGYKVYASNGAQIISPADKHIQRYILENLEPLESSWNTSILWTCEGHSDPLNDVLSDYLDKISNTILPELKENNEKMELLFTYTAMHGVGFPYVRKLCDRIGIKITPVPEQMDPNPDFPTVKFPNPEEGKSALDRAIAFANQSNSNIIIANDPDADRFAAAERRSDNPEWKVFTGNELGTLLGWWMLHCYKLKNPEQNLTDVYMIFSTVSSMILDSMSRIEGFKVVETLTGFKWMGNKAIQLMDRGRDVIFAFEESIGYMCGTTVLDKDGVSAAAHFTTMASFIYSEGKTVTEKLEDLYKKYGYHVCSNSYFICKDPKIIKQIFTRIRTMNQDAYPESILNGKYNIKYIRDLTTGFDNSKVGNIAILPVDCKSQMITFTFSNAGVCTLRTSGTEPKIKYYTELCGFPGETTKEAVTDTLYEMVKAVCDELLQPELNNLIPKSD